MSQRPPDGVVFVARTHWLVGAVILAGTLLLYFAFSNVPVVEFRARTYVIAGGLGGLYVLTGTLVWFGVPLLGPVLSRVCTLLYLPRPGMGMRIWDTMNSPEFKAHFARGARRAPS